MTLEISEIGVQMKVAGDPANPGANAGGELAGSTAPSPSRLHALVQACTQRVLAALRKLAAR